MIKLCSKIILTLSTKWILVYFSCVFLICLGSAREPFKGERSLICLPGRSIQQNHHLHTENNVSEILNWSLRPALPVGNMTVPMEQGCDLLVMLKVCNDPGATDEPEGARERNRIHVLHQRVTHKRQSPFCFLQLQSCKHLCWQHCQLRLWFPLNSFLFTPLHLSVKLSSKWDWATNLHYRRASTTNF